MASLVAAGLNYRCVRSRHIALFGGIRLDHEEGWEPLFRGIERTFRGLAGR